MSTVCSLNTLGGQHLVSRSTSTFLLKTCDLILDIVRGDGLLYNWMHLLIGEGLHL
jgi:hypothetical protein